MLIQKTRTIPLSWDQGGKSFESKIASVSSDENPSLFHVVHETHYSYSATIEYSKHLLRLQPVSDEQQSVLSYQCQISVNQCEVCNFVGVFGNRASFLEIKEPYSQLSIISESVVSIQDVSKRLDLLHQPRTLPMIWMPWDRMMMNAYLQPPELPESELFELAEYAMVFVKRNKNDVFAVLNDMNQTIFSEYTYMPGVTSFFTTPYEVYATQRGVCQDFAHLFICLARLLDIPARYRVGYLYTHSEHKNKAQADATHAWVEIYLPYLGWIGFDPTNGCEAKKEHIRVACGRYYSDATPTSGTIFRTKGEAKETLSTAVRVIRQR